MIRIISVSLSLIFLVAVAITIATGYLLWRFGQELPDYRQLATYEPPVMTRIHAGDGSLLSEYARERRLFVPVPAIPIRVIKAFLSAEDKTFYRHPGVDVFGIARAIFYNLRNLGEKRRPLGASTITQQVAKNFLLTNEVSIERKIKEAILAFRIEQALSKDRILELYLNEIYLGLGSYGIAAAALNYFNKSLDELSLDEAAYLAALPKAPNNYHPIRKKRAAILRRNWVLGRMSEDGWISLAEAKASQLKDLSFHKPDPTRMIDASYFTEEVRRELRKRYGEKRLYEGGLSVRTTLEPDLQVIAERALRNGLITYDRRKGWRGALGRIQNTRDWQVSLRRFAKTALIADWQIATVLKIANPIAYLGFADGTLGKIKLEELRWARSINSNGRRGPTPNNVSRVVSLGDVIIVSPVRSALGIKTEQYRLQQTPQINGAIIAMDPHTGRVLAMVGGFSFETSEFNRAVQARRQPGSAFKPFVYTAALERDFTPSSLILDAPFVIDLGARGRWKPANYSRKFYGPSTLRVGMEKSRNLMTVRLANHIGMSVVEEYARRFGLVESLPHLLPMALGAGETTLIKLVSAYSIFVNGGKAVSPTLIDRVQDRRGVTVYRHDKRVCVGCIDQRWRKQQEPTIPDIRLRAVDSATAYQIVSMLEGVVQRGTGRRIAKVGKPLAGKTGTTNMSRDTWFIGFSPDLAVGVYVGYDEPSSLGRRETGSSVAAPIFKDFMKAALRDKPGVPFRIPSNIQLVRIDSRTGLPATSASKNVILEAFKTGTIPTQQGVVLDGSQRENLTRGKPRDGTGGLY